MRAVHSSMSRGMEALCEQAAYDSLRHLYSERALGRRHDSRARIRLVEFESARPLLPGFRTDADGEADTIISAAKFLHGRGVTAIRRMTRDEEVM